MLCILSLEALEVSPGCLRSGEKARAQDYADDSQGRLIASLGGFLGRKGDRESVIIPLAG